MGQVQAAATNGVENTICPDLLTTASAHEFFAYAARVMGDSACGVLSVRERRGINLRFSWQA